jgi:CBS domain-containing protein
MRVDEVMTRDVTTVAPETPVREIARLMVERRVSAVPVVDAAGRLLGLVSEGDLLQRAETGTEERRSWWLDLFADPDARATSFLKAHGRTAAEVMVERLEVAHPDTPLDVAARLMHERRVKRLPVVEDGRLVGIVARADLLRALLQVPEPKAVSTDDLAIRDRFEATAKVAGLTGVGSVTIVVEDGMVQLWGLASTATERRALELAAAEIPGVRGVENHLAVRDELPAGP